MINKKFNIEQLFTLILSIISSIIIIYCLFNYLHITSYVMPAADDFTISADIKENLLRGENYLQTGCKLMCKTYLTWQGTFASNFLLYYAAPYVRMGVEGIRFFCVISILLFYGSVLWLVYCIMKYLFKIRNISIILFAYALIVWMISNARILMENFFWYNGICVYTLPVVCSLLGICCLFKYAFVNEKNRNLIGAIVFGIAACGGVLQCAAIVCFIYLLICLWACYTRHDSWRKIGIAFLSVLTSALVNCMAPGNFARHDVIDEASLPIIAAFGYSLQNVIFELKRLLLETDMPYLLMMILVIGFFAYYEDLRKIRVRGILLAAAGTFLCVWISCYPVALGYSSAAMEPRGYVIIDIFLIIGSIICSFLAGIFLHQCLIECLQQKAVLYGVVAIGAFIICVGINFAVPVQKIERPLRICMDDDRNGYLERFSDMWGDILQQINNSEERDVIIRSKQIPDPAILKNPDLSTDSNYWINQGAARYFDKETISIEWVR